MIKHLPHVPIQDTRLIQLDWKRDVRQAGTVFPHVLCFFVEAGIDCVILIPCNQTAWPRGLGVHEPFANTRDILFLEAPRPLVLMTLPASVHLKHMMDEFASESRSRPNRLQQNPSFVVLQSFGVLLNAVRDLDRLCDRRKFPVPRRSNSPSTSRHVPGRRHTRTRASTCTN